MPETPFTIKLPDGKKHHCYSPSSVVRQYFKTGDVLLNQEFLEKAEKALEEASDRVKSKFGFSCSAAMSSLATIQSLSSQYKADETIEILHI